VTINYHSNLIEIAKLRVNVDRLTCLFGSVVGHRVLGQLVSTEEEEVARHFTSHGRSETSKQSAETIVAQHLSRQLERRSSNSPNLKQLIFDQLILILNRC
jgi:hypothetical protein